MAMKPYLLADIPRDLTGLPGNIHATDVLTVAGSKKRKRSELALAIDRQGISIYDVQSSKLITCYALSPQAVFTCPPSSTRSRRLAHEPAQRYTYCSVTTPKPQLICFSEISNAEIKTSSINLSKEAAPISYLETLNADSGNKLLALRKDGTVTCYSVDLKNEEWHSSMNVGTSAIQAAATLSIQQARKTFLKGREDILVTLSPDKDAIDGNLLFVITRSPTEHADNVARTLELRIFHIRIANVGKTSFLSDIEQKLQLLATLAIPQPSHLVSREAQITIHTASGTVFQYAEGALAVYDLTGSIPRLVNTMTQEGVSSYLRLSSEVVASSRGGSFTIMNLTYGSLQDEGTLTLGHEAKVARKSDYPEDVLTTTENVRLLSYFAPLDIMVALDGRKVFAVQLFTTKETSGSRKRKRDGLLVNSIGRGSSSSIRASPMISNSARAIKSLGTYLPSSESDNWKAQEAALDRCIALNDEKELEILMAAALGINDVEEYKKASRPGVRKQVDEHALSFVLKAMFSVEQVHLNADPTGHNLGSLHLRLFPRTVGKWLIKKGLLTLSHIETSLKRSGALPTTSKLATGSLIQALAKWDSSLETLLSLLASPVPLSSKELVHVLAVIIQNPNEATEPQKLLTVGKEEDDSNNIETSQPDNGQSTDTQHSSSPSLPAYDLNRRLLTFTMKRLYACPSSIVARALKRELSTSQLRILVDSLRMEIARSGWLSPHEDSLDSLILSFQDDSQLCFIAHLLGCVIDSLGTAGWILGNSMSDELAETADTIAYMKAEISAALEGIEEATYLMGMLGEVLLCGKDSLNASPKQSRLNEVQSSVLPAKPVTIALDEEGSQLLPLGLKAAPVISTTKVGAGGELIKRSRRDIGRLKSRMVGKYSFDRIMI